MKMTLGGRIVLGTLPLAVFAGTATLLSSTSIAAGPKCVKFALVETPGTSGLTNDNVDPGNFGSTYAGQVAYDRLAVPDNNYVPQPQLATSWKSNAGATVWTFTLRQGVKFHDGKELTSADVVYSYRRLLDPKNYSFPYSLLSGFLKKNGIVAKGKYTVVFKPFKPIAELPYFINTNPMYVVEKGATTKTMATKDAGTGPFMTEKFTPGKFPYRFVKNPNYWDKSLPKSDCVDFFLIPEEASRAAALQTGQVDIVQALGFPTLPQLQNDKNIKVSVGPPGLSLTLSMWVDTAPFNDNRVRTAMKILVDRKKLVDTVFLGFAEVGDDNPIPPSSTNAWRHTVPGPNVDRAKQLLAAAGFGPSNPLKVNLYTAEALPNMLELAQAYAQQAAAAGVQVNVITNPPNDYFDKVWRHQPFASSGWNPRPPGEGLTIEYSQPTTGDPLGNETHWSSPAYFALVDKATATVDPAKRVALYKKAEEVMTLNGGEIRPVFVKTVAGLRANCSGYVPSLVFSRIEALKTAVCK
jgi:peptide/nickel transport system substrate-binding protein